MAINCAKCGYPIDPAQATGPCAACGSMDRSIILEDTVNLFEMIALKARDEHGVRLIERKQGEKLSRQRHKAREFLEFDHRNPETTTKTHTIEEQIEDGSWESEHNEKNTFPAKRRPKKIRLVIIIIK